MVVCRGTDGRCGSDCRRRSDCEDREQRVNSLGSYREASSPSPALVVTNRFFIISVAGMPPMNPSLQQRNEQLRRRMTPLPGSQPYENIRPIRIPARLDHWKLLDCVCEQHPHVSRKTWCEWFSQGHIRRRGVPADPMLVVRGGEEFEHAFPDTVEPDVNPHVVIAAEDANLIVVEKPAPLPIHPSGRFERNTLISFLQLVYPDECLKLVHRLDANTSGLVLIARSPTVATAMAKQFESGMVQKRYLVRCHGMPDRSEFSCDAPISSRRREGGTRDVDPIHGKQARTEFRVIKPFPDNTTLLEARPITGRTNQIRIHLWSLGHSVLGDPSYLPGGQIAAWQTLGVHDPPMCLHAAGLTVCDPVSGDEIHWSSDSPGWDQDDFNFSASASSLAMSSSNCFNSDKSSA